MLILSVQWTQSRSMNIEPKGQVKCRWEVNFQSRSSWVAATSAPRRVNASPGATATAARTRVKSGGGRTNSRRRRRRSRSLNNSRSLVAVLSRVAFFPPPCPSRPSFFIRHDFSSPRSFCSLSLSLFFRFCFHIYFTFCLVLPCRPLRRNAHPRFLRFSPVLLLSLHLHL